MYDGIVWGVLTGPPAGLAVAAVTGVLAAVQATGEGARAWQGAAVLRVHAAALLALVAPARVLL